MVRDLKACATALAAAVVGGVVFVHLVRALGGRLSVPLWSHCLLPAGAVAKQLALHLWMFDMASSVRTQLMFGESGDPVSRVCANDSRPATQRLATVRATWQPERDKTVASEY